MKIHSGLFAFEMQLDGAHDEMQVWRWARLNAGAELLYLRRGLARASFVAYFACNRFALRRLWIRAPASTTNAAKQASAAAAT